MTAPGTPLHVVGGQHIQRAAVSSSDAARDVVAAYLRTLTFVIPSRDGAREFQLERVFTDWPAPNEVLPYPCASVTLPTELPIDRHNTVPTPVEDSWDVHRPNSALWKLGERIGELQVDFWTNTVPARDAIDARLPSAFAPGEDASVVLLAGVEGYWCATVKASYEGSMPMDNATSVAANERRLRARIRVSIDELELRCAVAFRPDVRGRIEYEAPRVVRVPDEPPAPSVVVYWTPQGGGQWTRQGGDPWEIQQ